MKGGEGPAGLLHVPSRDGVSAAGFPSDSGYLSQDSVPWRLGDVQSSAGRNWNQRRCNKTWVL